MDDPSIKSVEWFTPSDFAGTLELQHAERKVSVESVSANEALLFPAGTILVVGIGATLGKVGFVCKPASANQQVNALIPRCGTSTRYIAHVLSLLGDLMNAWANSATLPILNQQRMGDVIVIVPPLKEQKAIADYLDRETARLDTLVATKERVLGLLAEKRRALITWAVTLGLDSDAPLSDSGVPWLGGIPIHWRATRLKFVADVRGGFALGQKYGIAELTEYPYLRVANVQDGHLDLSDVATVFLPKAEAASCILQPGDVLMNEGGDADKLGRGCVWNGEVSPCLHQNHVFAVRPRNVLSEWLDAWTSTEGAKNYFESRAKQSTNLASISARNIKELPVPLPPIDEQRAIVAHIRAETAKITAMQTATERTISLLKERRAALISAAVTGQIDVGVEA